MIGAAGRRIKAAGPRGRGAGPPRRRPSIAALLEPARSAPTQGFSNRTRGTLSGAAVSQGSPWP